MVHRNYPLRLFTELIDCGFEARNIKAHTVLYKSAQLDWGMTPAQFSVSVSVESYPIDWFHLLSCFFSLFCFSQIT